MEHTEAPIALLTDFGHKEPFVGMMEGVILGICPEVPIVHLTHEIAPQDVRLGAFHLMCAVSYFPKNTLFVCVVDPGVGSERSILYMETSSHRFLAPDNGLLSWAAASPKRVLAVKKSRYFLHPVSQTFHGRDIFAPVAAHLMKGLDPQKLGPRVSRWVQLPFPRPRRNRDGWEGEILAIDRFGNMITNFRQDHLNRSNCLIRLGTNQVHAGLNSQRVCRDDFASDRSVPASERTQTEYVSEDTQRAGAKAPGIPAENLAPRVLMRGLAKFYAGKARGKMAAIVGSCGFLEIAVSGGNAALLLRGYVGQKVYLR